MNIKAEKISIRVPGADQPMGAWLAVPDGAGAKPAVIVFAEIFGVNAHIRDVTERVAREGYVAIAPDLHHRTAPGLESKYDEEGGKRGMALIPLMTQPQIFADVNATLEFLRARPDVKRDRIGTIGFCIGGHLTYLVATGTDVRATVSFYGGGITQFTPGGGPPTVERTGQIKGSILCLFGGKDARITAEHVETIRQALRKNRVRHDVIVYPEAGHGFFCDQRGSYHPQSAAHAWINVKKFFAAALA